MTDSLLSRLQSLTEPSREIDAEVALANGWYIGKTVNEGAWFSPDGAIQDEPPRYTESLDAALMLIPDDFEWEIGSLRRQLGRQFEAVLYGHDGYRQIKRHAATPAIALLIAIMKAKEESKP